MRRATSVFRVSCRKARVTRSAESRLATAAPGSFQPKSAAGPSVVGGGHGRGVKSPLTAHRLLTTSVTRRRNRMRRRVLIENGPIGSTKTLSPMICNVNSCQWQWFASGGGPTSGDGPAGGDGEGGKSVNSPPAPPPSESEAENRTGVVIEDVDAEISPTSGGEGSGETEETGKAMPKDDGTGEAEAEAEEEEDDEEAMILQAKLARAAYKRQVSSLRRDFRSTSERRKARKAKQARVRKEQAKAKSEALRQARASASQAAEAYATEGVTADEQRQKEAELTSRLRKEQREEKRRRRAVTRSRQRFEVAQFLDRLKEGSKHWITKENIDTRITAKMFEGDVMASPASLAEVGETDISYLSSRPYAPSLLEAPVRGNRKSQSDVRVTVTNVYGVDKNEEAYLLQEQKKQQRQRRLKRSRERSARAFKDVSWQDMLDAWTNLEDNIQQKEERAQQKAEMDGGGDGEER